MKRNDVNKTGKRTPNHQGISNSRTKASEGQTHTLITGPTGIGKTQSLLLKEIDKS